MARVVTPEQRKAWNAAYRKKHPERNASYKRRWNSDNTARVKANNRRCKLRLKYGMSIGDYESMCENQGGRCLICCEVPATGPGHKGLCVDHCHKTGAVRGLLCSQCNTAIGMFRDSPEIIQRAMEYLS